MTICCFGARLAILTPEAAVITEAMIARIEANDFINKFDGNFCCKAMANNVKNVEAKPDIPCVFRKLILGLLRFCLYGLTSLDVMAKADKVNVSAVKLWLRPGLGIMVYLDCVSVVKECRLELSFGVLITYDDVGDLAVFARFTIQYT